MRTVIAMALLALSSSALAGYKLGAQDPAANLVVDAQSDSTGTTISVVYASANADEKCAPSKRGFRLGGDSTTGHAPAVKPVRIAANELFAFTATYNEARGGQNRACSVTAAFTPQPDHNYLARIVTSNQVERCDMAVFDVTDGRARSVDFHMPEFVCGKKAPTRQPNGKPVIIPGVILIPVFYRK
jgi:hypothetical protein